MSDDAIPAATLILVRERGSGPPELLMVERAESMAFAAGAWVFPGGRIDEGDERLAGRFAAEHGSAKIAAIRETIEETAVPAGLGAPPRPEHCLDIQAALAAGQEFDEIVDQAGLALDLDALTPLARWVPRFHAKRRFDTLFFVARVPDGDWQPNVFVRECSGAHWASAAEVLERDRAGELQLIFPTRRTLERLAQHASYDEIVADARAHAIDPISPWVDEVGGERFITIPDGIGFPVTRERLEGLWRG
jgi:8-oxo-dGTP pyrophosphatase MutT (NUDIX family)